MRPLLDDLRLEAAAAGEPVVLRIRTRFRPELGSGRPEEVIAALGDASGTQLEVRRTVRERLILVEDLPSP